MRSYKYTILLLFVLSVLQTTTFAFDGKTHIPTYRLGYIVQGGITNYTFIDIYLSNVTSTNVDVSLVFYDAEGEPILNSTNYTYSLECAENVTTYSYPSEKSLSFSIPSYGSIRCKLMKNSAYECSKTYGYGVLEYSQDAEFMYSLIGSMSETHYKKGTDNSDINNKTIPLNQGRPF